MASNFDDVFGKPAGSNARTRFDDVFGAPEPAPDPRIAEALGAKPGGRTSTRLGMDAPNAARATEVLGSDNLTLGQQKINARRAAEEAARDKAADEKALEEYQEQARQRAGGAWAGAVKGTDEPYEIAASGGDSFGTLAGKWTDNLGPRLKKAAGGIVQWLGDEARDDPGVLMSDKVREFGGWLTDAGKQMGQEGSAALQANAPDYGKLGDNHPYRYLYDLSNSIVDLAAAAGASAVTRSPGVGAQMLGAQVFGNQYDDSRRMGRSEDQSFMDAAFMAVAEEIGEAKVIGGFIKPGVGTLGSAIKHGAKSEGLQEMVTGILQTGYDKGVLHPEMTWGQAARSVIDSGLLGAGAGATVGAGAHGLNKWAGTTTPAAPVDPLAPPAADPMQSEALARGAPSITADDEASPLSTELIAQGRGQIDIDTEAGGMNAVLREYGLPTTGADVVVNRGPDGAAQTGKMLGTFDVTDNLGTKRGVRIAMNDGSTYEELIDDIQAGGHSIRTVEDYTTPAPVAAEPAQQTPVSSERPVAPAQEQGATGRDVLKAKMRTAESGGNDRAKNRNSSAAGRYQFIDSTWAALGGDPSKRYDPAEQERLMDKLVDQNEAALRKAGFQTTAGNLYLAHFLGAGGARNALANPDGAVSEAVQNANPFAKGWTNGQLAAWADRKMGGKGIVAIPGGTWTPDLPEGVDYSGMEFPKNPETGEIEIDHGDALDAGPSYSEKATSAFEQAKAERDALEAKAKDASAALAAFPKDGKLGLTPDSVKLTPEWQKAKASYDGAAKDLATFNGTFTKEFKADLAAERAARVPTSEAAPTMDGSTAAAPDLDAALDKLDKELEAMRGDKDAEGTPLHDALKVATGGTGVTSWSRGPDGVVVYKGALGVEAAREAGRDDIADAILERARRDVERAEAAAARKPDNAMLAKSVEDNRAALNAIEAAARPTAAAPAMTEAEARAQTDPALDWDSSERDVRAGLLRKVGLSADLSRKVAGASFDEMAPDLRSKIETELRKGYAAPAAAALEGAKIDANWTEFAPGTGTLGIPRADMPQIEGKHRGAMVNFLNAGGISHSEETVDPASLKPSQREFSPTKVAAWEERASKPRSILVSSDDHVIDGHHQWVRAATAGEPINIIRLGAPARDVLAAMKLFPSATTDGGSAPSRGAPTLGHRDDDTYTAADIDPPSDNHTAHGRKMDARPDNQLEILGAIERGMIRDGDMIEMGSPRWALERGFADIGPADGGRRGRLTEAGKAKLAELRGESAPLPATKAVTPKATKPRAPVSAMAFVRKRGGIKSGRHDLRNMGALARYPGVINNKRGLTIDEMGEALHEAGYFNRGGERPTEAEVLEYLSNASIKHAYPIGEAPETSQDDDEQRYHMTAALEAVIEDAGIKFNDDELADALRYLEAGNSPQAAVEAAMVDQIGRTLEASADESGNAFYDSKKDEIYEGQYPEERGPGVDESVAGSEGVEGDAGRSGARAAEPQEAPSRVEPSATREGAPWAPVTTGVSLTDSFSILRDNEVAKPVLELDGKTPTGWLQIPLANGDGAILIHGKRDEGREFTGKGWRQYAPAYAMDHADPAPAASPDPAKPTVSTARLESTTSGKGVALIGASPAEAGAVARALGDKAKGVARKDGAIVYSAKHEATIRRGLAKAADDARNAGIRKKAPLTPDSRADAVAKLEAGERVFNLAREDIVWLEETGTGWTVLSQELKSSITRQLGGTGFDPWSRSTAARRAGESFPDGSGWAAAETAKPKDRSFAIVMDPAKGTVTTVPATSAAPAPTRAPSPARAPVAPEGYEVEPAYPVPDPDDARRNGGKFSAVARREKPWSSERGFGNTPADAQRDALRRVGAPLDTPADVLAPRADDQKNAAQRKADEALKPKVEQKAAGSDGGLFDTQDSTGDLFDAPKVTKAVTPTPEGWGANNKLVTTDRAAELRAKLRDKFKTQLNSGIDPEMLAMGTELAVFHIEAGARKFADFAAAMMRDLGITLAQAKPFLRGWYNGARDMMEDSGALVGDMDTSENVRAELARLETTVETATSDPKETEDAGSATEAKADGADRGNNEGTRAEDAREPQIDREPQPGADRPGGASGSELSDSVLESDGERDGERSVRGAQRSGANGAGASRRVRGKPAERGANFLAKAGALKREGGWLQTAQRNLDIIELVNKLEGEGRPATAAEQALLAKFTGWGAGPIRNALFKNIDRKAMEIMKPAEWERGEWRETILRARDLLKGEDLRVAMQSVQYAHYTSEGVVRAMWDGLARMGFGGGKILEPGMGIGNFFTAAPADAMASSSYTGIELDAFTARIAKLLLPQENVIQGDFTKQALPDGFFDAAIGNPPFSSLKVLDDPAYKKHRFSLHDYFFAKSIDKVRPGGLLTFITSRYTMDKLDPKARQYIADRADFLGAIRLPQTAFKENAGTEVVTDVLFFQRRAPGAEPGGVAWLGTKEVSVGGVKIALNEYFADNKDMILGKNATERGQFSANDYTVEPYATGTIESHFAKAIKSLPENIYTEQPRAASASLTAKAYERDFAPASAKEGGLYVKDGKVLVVDQGSGVPIESLNDKLKPADHAWLKDYAPLRDALKVAQKDQLGDGDWEKSHGALVKAYRAFTKKHGRIREFTPYERTTTDDEGVTTTLTYKRFKWDKLLALDVEGPLVSQLERITDDGKIIDGPFLLGRTLNKPTRPQIETVEDAMAVTLDEIGKLDLDYVAHLAKLSRDEVVERLGDGVFRSPAGDWQTADEYLSGDVLKKLEEAQAAAAAEPEFERNVKALIAVQPAPLAYHNITVKLGAPWLRPETISQFADEVLGFANLPIKYEPATAHWNVEGAKRWQGRNLTNEYGTDQRSAVELLDAVLNNRSIRILTPKDSDGKQTTDATATTAAVEAAKKIAERFKTWLWEDSARTSEYVETYNRSYNNLAPRRFNGDHLTLPGLTSRYKLHPHQKRAVWRMIQTGNTYLAHAVGAGKTLEMIVGGMEQRRLGLIKKPMYVVPNHMLNQFAGEFLEAYPAANIMVADEKQFHTGNRRRFLAQVSLNDPDAIILTHSSFGKIDTSVEARRAVLDDMIAELEDALEGAKDDVKQGAGRHTVSRLEKQIEQLTRRFEGRQGQGKDALLTFDEMGVDYLFIDEAHEFRKLDFATNRVAKGIDSAGSAKALDLFIKSRWLQKRNPGRNLTLASGTAVTNTMAELFTVMRYMAMDGLERDGIKAFDAWASMFGEVVAGYEQNAAGGYEIVERFAKFVNVPELMKRVREFMDVLTSDQLGDLVKRPKVNGGIPASMVAKATPALEDFMQGTLNERLERSRKWKPSKDQPGNPDPVINIITDARLASIDMRFVSSGRKSEPSNKLNTMIAKIAEIHNATAAREYLDKSGKPQPIKGATQIVFSAVGFGDQVAASRGFDARAWINDELTRMGVKPGEVGWMSDANSHAKKEQLQKDVRSGKVRILIGSPKNMGTGLNVQDRLIALHYLSPPWYPADVEQPHGRIIRQGNLNADVDLFWYATKGTYDSTAWGMVSRKQKFIEQAMSGDDSVRTLEDISEASQYEMAAALAAGDDRIIAVAGLSGDIERLQRLKMAHADNQRNLRESIRDLQKRQLPRLTEREATLLKANEARGTGYKPFEATVGGQAFTAHGKAGEALIAAAQKVIDDHIAVPRTEIGRYHGFPIIITPGSERSIVGDMLGFEVEIGGYAVEAGRQFSTLEGKDPVGLMRSIELAVQSIPSALQEVRTAKADAERTLAASEKRYGAPFPEEAQLSEKVAERAQLQAELAAETAAKAPKGSAKRGAATPPIPEEKAAELKVALTAQLKALGIGDRISLEVANGVRLAKDEFQGQYWNRVITIAVNRADNPFRTNAHESWHAIKELGLVTPTEIRLIEDKGWAENAEWARTNYPDSSLADQREEAGAEWLAQYWETTTQGSFMVRVAVRVMGFLRALRRAVNVVQGKAPEFAAADVAGSILKGEVGSRPTGFGGATVRGKPVTVTFGKKPMGSVAAFANPATEAEFQDATKGIGDGPGLVEKAGSWLEDLKAGFSRHWRDLPNLPKFADLQQQLRKLEAAPEAALEQTMRHLKALVAGLDRTEMDVLRRKVVLDDLMWEAGQEHKLPFGFTPDSLRAELANIDALLGNMPKVRDAVRRRKLANRRLADEMVTAGVLTPEQVRNPAYFRHMVLDFARTEAKLARGGKVKSPYWAKRMGSTLAINANLLEAEFDWMQKALTDIATARTIEWIKDSEHNIRERLRAQAKAENKAGVAARVAADRETAIIDAKFRQAMGHGMSIVKQALESGALVPPPHLQAMADSVVNNGRDGFYPLLSWIMDENKPGAMGAAMVLSATGRRKAWEKRLLGQRYVDADDIASLVDHYKPEGFTTWQPRDGQHFFTSKSISEHALDMFVGKLGAQKYEGVSEEELVSALGSIKPQLVVGGDRYTMVVPDEVALTLDGYGDRRSAGMVAQVFGGLQGAWKQWTLINPRRFFKYNLNNLSGDLDAIIAGNPGTLRRVGVAASEIYNVWVKKAAPSAAYSEAVERGVFTSGLSVQEIPDINRMRGLRHLMEPSRRPDKLVAQAAANVWGAMQGATNFREAVFRYAAYLDYKQKIESGKPQLEIGYGASVPAMVDAVTDPADRAALLARDLVGDYGSISVAGGWLRRYLIPFWSWREINTKRYWRLTNNAFRVSNARGLATGGLLGAGIAGRAAAVMFVRMAVVYGLIYLWNNLLFGDEEDDLGDSQKRQLHLILGRDDKGEVQTLRLQGALSDVLGTLGFEDAVAGIKRWQNGQGTIGQAIGDTLKAPVNAVLTSTTPMFTTPLEQALDLELWPDAFNPREIKDNWRHVWSTFSLENEYDAIAKRPSRGYARSWTESLIYRRDPGEMAYDTARGIAYDWLENVKGLGGGVGRSDDRAMALRDYKMAMRYGDHDAANAALDTYESFGGTGKGLKTSIARAHPLGPIKASGKKNLRPFVESLTEEQLEIFRDAETWYDSVYLGSAGDE